MTERFHRHSPPYLFATELPFNGLRGLVAPGSSCLTVAGSGDVPLWLLSLGAGRVVGVDVSLNSLALAEIKARAAKVFSFEEFLYFFLGGSERAATLLGAKPLEAPYREERWLGLALRLKDGLSRRARGFLFGLKTGAQNPFAGMPRPTDLAVLGGIPFLTDKDAFGAVSRKAGPYPLVAARLEDYLARTSRSFDLVYLSNLPEYFIVNGALAQREKDAKERVVRLHSLAASRLTHRGVLVSYHFHSQERLGPCCELALGVLERFGCTMERKGIDHVRKSPLMLRLRHHLLVAKRGLAARF